MYLQKKCTAINALIFLTLLLLSVQSYAAPVVGTITNLSGHLLSKSSDGKIKILSQDSVVEQGDTLITEKDTYAKIKFIDKSETTLSPNTQFKIENFSFDKENPDNDGVVISLIKGGLRNITGLLGKRNHDRFSIKTPAATIGIRGTTFILEYIPTQTANMAAYRYATMAAAMPINMGQEYFARTDTIRTDAPLYFVPASGIIPLQLALDNPTSPAAGGAPGLYVQVIEGMINLTNSGGSQNFSAGQFGYTASFTQLPVVLPSNPGMQFNPPPSFSSSTIIDGASNNREQGKEVDCEVR